MFSLLPRFSGRTGKLNNFLDILAKSIGGVLAQKPAVPFVIEVLKRLLIVLHILITDFRSEIDLCYAKADRVFDNRLVHTGTAVQNQRNIRELPHIFQHIQMNVRLSVIIAMRVSDPDRKCVRPAQAKKFPP